MPETANSQNTGPLLTALQRQLASSAEDLFQAYSKFNLKPRQKLNAQQMSELIALKNEKAVKPVYKILSSLFGQSAGEVRRRR